ncbi:hypothetical protein OPV22_023327 [Ensete ventricosum]|uniref:Uncharacterized protein n=1 Tax=Ensete ventricosum TaxID=4639 RepID=A0AAV8PCP4_ENSVE|nr:hypothetical protein OPV22_023327 [Ensete ventricosum]
MGKKRKSQDTHLDEADRTIYSVFRGAANSLSLIYTQAMAQQVLAFQAGERHALEKLDQLILRHDEGSRVTVADILAYLQNEIGYGGEDTSMSPIPHLAHQYPQSSLQFRSTNIHNSSMVGTAAVGLARTGHCEETKNTVFSNALSSPVRRSLESYHPTQGRASHDNALPPENTNRNHGSNHLDQSQDSRTSSDSSMDMHSDRADL